MGCRHKCDQHLKPTVTEVIGLPKADNYILIIHDITEIHTINFSFTLCTLVTITGIN